MASRVVHKFPVEAAGEFAPVPMPITAEILHADVQGDQVFVWALVAEAAEPLRNRHLGYFGTGHPVPPRTHHIGSCIERKWGLVWHVFEDFSDHRGGDASDGGSVRPSSADVAEAASSGAGAASLALPAPEFERVGGMPSAFERLRRTFGFDYWDEPATGGEVA